MSRRLRLVPAPSSREVLDAAAIPYPGGPHGPRDYAPWLSGPIGRAYIAVAVAWHIALVIAYVALGG